MAKDRCYEKRIKQIRDNITQLRQYYGLKQSEFSERTNMPRTTLNMIEKGNRDPSLEVLCNISRAFQIELSDLVKKSGFDAIKRLRKMFGKDIYYFDTTIKSVFPLDSRFCITLSEKPEELRDCWCEAYDTIYLEKSAGHDFILSYSDQRVTNAEQLVSKPVRAFYEYDKDGLGLVGLSRI